MRSMTGYGQARHEGDGWVTQVEVRSVNGRYFKLSARVPHEFGAFERDFEKRIRRRIARGSVDLTVKVELTGERAARPLNVRALTSYVRSLQELGRELNVPVALTADALASLPGVLDAEELREEEAKALVDHLTAALDAALDEADRMRQAEGANLRAELLAHCEAIERMVAEVEEAQPAALEEHQRRLVERVNRLLQNTGIAAGEENVAREVAIFADRSNVSEEIARLRSHVKQLREALDKPEPVGRRLEFIAQELQREANTLSAKVAGASLARQIVALHSEVDSIREQVLNVE
jgi:uncharacterized protein (TIGR00255 family)